MSNLLEQKAAQVIEAVRGFVARAVEPLHAKLAEVEQRIAAIPAGEKGERGEPGAPGVDGQDGMDGAPGERGAPGFDGKDGANGLNGKDGADGLNGKDADPIVIKALVAEAAAAIQPVHGKDGRDGRDGEDGRDAFAIDVLPAINEGKSYPRGTWAHHNGGLWHARSATDGMAGWACIVNGIAGVEVGSQERNFTVKALLSDGTAADHVFALPVLLDRGVYKAEEPYVKGDVTTWDGSMWIAQKNTTDKPGTSDAWRLSVKKGRDGRDGLKGEKGERGAEGRSGKDMTQLGTDGSKW